jgi:drug/metabolite transporter (DMT)-like permease
MMNWFLFVALGAIWGSSFLLIKIGLEELNTFFLVSGRLGVTTLAFVTAFILARKQLPRDRATLGKLTLVGIIGTTIPFLLITWAETSIDSGLASVLNATVPLFSLVIAHIALSDDKINTGKLLGLATGFIGVVILAQRSAAASTPNPQQINPLLGLLAMLAATFCYACAAVYTRRNLRGHDAVVTAGMTNIIGAIVVIVASLLLFRPLPNIAALKSQTVLAIVTLGVLNTFIANIIYFHLIKSWGASRATTVTYLVPVVGLILGTLAAHEAFDLQLLLGAALIIGGVALANFRKSPPRQPTPVEAASVSPADRAERAIT